MNFNSTIHCCLALEVVSSSVLVQLAKGVYFVED